MVVRCKLLLLRRVLSVPFAQPPTLVVGDVQSVIAVVKHPLSPTETLLTALGECARLLAADIAAGDSTPTLDRSSLHAITSAVLTLLCHGNADVRASALEVVLALSTGTARNKQALYELQTIGLMRIIMSTDNAPPLLLARAATVLGNLSTRDGGAMQTAVVTGGAVPHLLGT